MDYFLVREDEWMWPAFNFSLLSSSCKSHGQTFLLAFKREINDKLYIIFILNLSLAVEYFWGIQGDLIKLMML